MQALERRASTTLLQRPPAERRWRRRTRALQGRDTAFPRLRAECTRPCRRCRSGTPHPGRRPHQRRRFEDTCSRSRRGRAGNAMTGRTLRRACGQSCTGARRRHTSRPMRSHHRRGRSLPAQAGRVGSGLPHSAGLPRRRGCPFESTPLPPRLERSPRQCARHSAPHRCRARTTPNTSGRGHSPCRTRRLRPKKTTDCRRHSRCRNSGRETPRDTWRRLPARTAFRSSCNSPARPVGR